MWRSVTGERGGSGGASASPAAGPELTSAGFHSHDSPLLGLLSAVSRPAVSLLQRCLPGRAPLTRDSLEPQQLHSLPWFNLDELGLHGGFPGSVLEPPPRAKGVWSGMWSGAGPGERAGAAADKGVFGPGLTHLKLIQSSLGVCGDLCGDLSALSPDQDHGYCSLEEEQLLGAKARLQEKVQSALLGLESAQAPEEAPQEEPEEPEELPALTCDNKTIAFIMGCPCSDDDEDSSEEEEQEDDGFDAVCSSSQSEDECDSKTGQLWSSLCQNPRNFTAELGSAPRAVPGAEEEQQQQEEEQQQQEEEQQQQEEEQQQQQEEQQQQQQQEEEEQQEKEEQQEEEEQASSSWDEASESEEQENLKLLGSFCSSDPYSPLNFQAPIRTKTRAETKAEPESEQSRVRKVSECSPSSSRAPGQKKVHFNPEVQVFTVGSEERRGPWLEMARDRDRFLKRCRDTEQVLSACLRPEHRARVYERLDQSEPRGEEPITAQGQRGGANQSPHQGVRAAQPIRVQRRRRRRRRREEQNSAQSQRGGANLCSEERRGKEQPIGAQGWRKGEERAGANQSPGRRRWKEPIRA